jgi:hypothetical protein
VLPVGWVRESRVLGSKVSRKFRNLLRLLHHESCEFWSDQVKIPRLSANFTTELNALKAMCVTRKPVVA